MRFVIQRVMHSKVTINGEVRGQIGKGFMVLIGVGEEDTVEIADKMIHKMVNMRIFEDENGKTNLGLKEPIPREAPVTNTVFLCIKIPHFLR